MYRKAQRRKAKLRMALIGPSGSGKTYSALLVASGMGGPIAMIDTEQGSGELYADLCDYDVCTLTAPFTPHKYIQAIREAESAGYSVLIIDSLSHAWAGEGGLLEEVDKRKATQKNQFAAWRDITPMHNQLVDAMLQSPCHIVATMRSKTAYDVQRDEKGNVKPVKIGQAPVQRDGMEYEFTAVLDLEAERHIAAPSKDRTGLLDGHHFVPSPRTGAALREWLEAGAEPVGENTQPAAAPGGEAEGQVDTPEPEPQKQGKPATQAQVRKINALCGELGITERDDRLKKINLWLQQRSKPMVNSTKELGKEDASGLIELLQSHVEQLRHMQSREAAQPETAG
jgi:hypothetical protein